MIGVGMFAGVSWHLISLSCMRRLLAAWLHPRPSIRAVVGWVIVKIALVLALAAALARAPMTALLGFGIGFTCSLALAVAWWARRSALESR